MHKLIAIALVAFVASVNANAEPPSAPAKSTATPVAAVTPAAAPIAQKTAAVSQQDKMRNCNKQATGKKGAERRTFMKTCLSSKPSGKV